MTQRILKALCAAASLRLCYVNCQAQLFRASFSAFFAKKRDYQLGSMHKTFTNNSEIFFISLAEEYFSLIYAWFNKPHVQAFYSLRTWTIEEIRQKLTPYIQGVGNVRCYLIFLGKKPIGYLQCYPVKNHPWDNQNLSEDIVQHAAGIDLFIGEENYVGKGLGCHILDSFLNKYIWPHYKYCLADPDVRNLASLGLFKKCGFKEHQLINSTDALNRHITLQLLIRER